MRSGAAADDAFGPVAAAKQPAGAKGPAFVDITWMSITNMLYELGTFGVLTDGYITPHPAKRVFWRRWRSRTDAGKPHVSDVAAVKRVLTALGGPSRIALLLTGHSHFDHSFDTATWSKLTNAPIIGSKTTCLQAEAAGLPQTRCRAVFGGERIAITDGVCDARDPVEPQRRFDDQSGAAQSRRARHSAADRSGHGRSARRGHRSVSQWGWQSRGICS